MKAVISRFLKSDKGEGIISGLYSLLLATIVLMIAIEAAGYSMRVWKLRQVSMETLNQMKVENGLNNEIKSQFLALLDSYGLKDVPVEIQGTPQYVQRGDLLELNVRSIYTLNCLKPFGRTIQLPLNIQVRGLAHTFLRDEAK